VVKYATFRKKCLEEQHDDDACNPAIEMCASVEQHFLHVFSLSQDPAIIFAFPPTTYPATPQSLDWTLDYLNINYVDP
jgi:hypothetical protein